MTREESQALARLQAHYRDNGQLLQAETIKRARRSLSELGRPAKVKVAPAPPAKVYPPARRDPSVAMLFGPAGAQP